jgi:hypothetical protein
MSPTPDHNPHHRLQAFKEKVRRAHAVAFQLHLDTGELVEAALLTAHDYPNEIALVLDMLLLQGYKAHMSVMLLCDHALVEDAATITRRLLELSVQAAYITAPSSEPERQRRAGRYLAFIWRRFPPRFRSKLPRPVRVEWSRIARRYGRWVPRKAKRWGPDFRKMFEEVGQPKTYDTDYAFLSSISHGRPEEQVIAYSQPSIRVTPHHHVSTILVFASRYHFALAGHWDGYYGLLDERGARRIHRRLLRWQPREAAA